MAADVYGLLMETELPPGWDHAVTPDGRVFFVNDLEGRTTWLSPVTQEPVQTGHTTSLGLPRGWELAYLPDGIKYYIDHNSGRTTFTNPISGKAEAAPTRNGNNVVREGTSSTNPLQGDYVDVYPTNQVTPLQEPYRHTLNPTGYRAYHDYQHAQPLPQSIARLGSPANPQFLTNSPVKNNVSAAKTKANSYAVSPRRSSKKTSKKLDGPEVKSRRLDLPVSMRGWLDKLESKAVGVRQWKRRFFVLSNFCLYAYKDSREDEILYSILLPSYKIRPDRKYNKEYALKAEHDNMKTHYFAADHQPDMDRWIRAMSLAAVAQEDPLAEQEFSRTEGDGTDSPMVSTPPRDSYRNGRYPYSNNSTISPNMSRSPGLSHSYSRHNNAGYRPNDFPENSWQPPMSPPYAGEWQVRDQYDAALPAASVSYQQPSAFSPSDSFRVPNYEYFDSGPPHGHVEPQPYTPPRPDKIGHGTGYWIDQEADYQYNPSVAPHHPVHSQPFRNNNAYSMSYRTNNDFPENSNRVDVAFSPDDSRYSYRANGVPIRGEPRTPQSVVSPPWRRDHPHTPTYRPPHTPNSNNVPPYVNNVENIRDPDAPPRPQKLTSKLNQLQGSSYASVAPPTQANEFGGYLQEVRHDLRASRDRDKLHAMHNVQCRRKESLIFQFPEPYKPPHWLQGPPVKNMNGVTHGYRPVGYNVNGNNNAVISKDQPPVHHIPGQSTFKPPKVDTYKQVNPDDLIGKSKEELVLLLIELRRQQAQMESAIASAQTSLGQANIELNRLISRNENTGSIERDMGHLNSYIEEVRGQLEMQKPMVALIDNLVKMPATNNAQNFVPTQKHISNQNRDHRKTMDLSELSRDTLMRSQDNPYHPGDSLMLERKLEELYQSDQSIQRQNNSIKSINQQVNTLEDMIINLNDQLQQTRHPIHVMNDMMNDRHLIEQDIYSLRKQLSVESQKLEAMTSQNSNLQQEVIKLRQDLKESLQRSKSLHTLQSSGMNGQGDDNMQRPQQITPRVKNPNSGISEAMSNFRISSNRVQETSVASGRPVNQNPIPARPKSYHDGIEQAPIYSVIKKPKAMTLRDLKRASASRIEQQREADMRQLNPAVTTTSSSLAGRPHSLVQNHNDSRLLISDDIKPFKADQLFFSPDKSLTSQNFPSKPKANEHNAARGRAQSRRKENRARYLTISSSQPLQLEATSLQKRLPNAFDQGQLVRSTTNIDRDYTADDINSQLLAPEKIFIPERYVPDSSDEEQLMSEEEKTRRAEKAEQIRKMVASQSLQEFTKSEIDASDEEVSQKLGEEKRRREAVLEMRYEMAKEVTRKSKESREENAFQIARESVQAHRDLLRRSSSFRQTLS